jgi:predicted metal-binding membrane protein
LTRHVLRHERLIVAGSIALLVALSWGFLANGAGMPRSMGMAMQPPLAALIAMWWLMMVAMMLPSAAPAILLYAKVRDQRGSGARVVQPWLFALGYLAVWLLFSVVAAFAQQLASEPAKTLNDRFAAAALIGAGLYQLSPLKSACLRQCRTPAQFLSRHWRPGVSGAVRLGILHGLYCLGCCWMLMALLFVGGVMNLLWVVALTLIVAVEKLAPGGPLLGRAAGVGLIGWGLLRLAV